MRGVRKNSQRLSKQATYNLNKNKVTSAAKKMTQTTETAVNRHITA